jgi:hypothetical protein
VTDGTSSAATPPVPVNVGVAWLVEDPSAGLVSETGGEVVNTNAAFLSGAPITAVDASLDSATDQPK